MKMDRRTFLSASLAVGAMPVFAGVTGSGAERILGVVDRALPETVQLMTDKFSVDDVLEVAPLDAVNWQSLMATSVSGVDKVVAYTRWSDYLLLRDVLREKGLKLRGKEQRIDLASGDSVFFWQMA